jgi:hypothetical protein
VRRPLAILLLLGACAAADPAPGERQDVVILDNRQRLRGTVIDAERPDRITIRTGAGTITLARERVVSIDLGVASRVAYTAPDDAAALIELALWCRARGHNAEALEALTKAVALPGCPLAAKGLHARMVDERQGPEAALPLYRAWRAAGGDEPEHLARLAQLEAAGAGSGPLVAVEGNRPPPAPPAQVTPPPPPAAKGLDAGWRAEAADWANTTTVEAAALPDDGGRDIAGMRLSAAGGSKDKGAIRRQVRLDLSDPATSTLTFRAQNPGTRDLALAVAVKTGNGWTYFESLAQRVPAGRAAVLRFDLQAPTWKSAASSWRHDGRVGDLNDVRELQILIMNGGAPAEVVVGGIDVRSNKDL